MKIHGGGFIGRVAEQAIARTKEQVRALVDGFKGALEQKDIKQLAQVLRDVKALKPGGENQFLVEILRALGKEVPVQGPKAGLRDVMLALSPEQRQELARELFGGKLPLLGKPGLITKNPQALEAMLAKFLSSIGRDPMRFPAIHKDQIIRGPGSRGSFPKLPEDGLKLPDRKIGIPFDRPINLPFPEAREWLGKKMEEARSQVPPRFPTREELLAQVPRHLRADLERLLSFRRHSPSPEAREWLGKKLQEARSQVPPRVPTVEELLAEAPPALRRDVERLLMHRTMYSS